MNARKPPEQRHGSDSGFVAGQKLIYRDLGWKAEVEVLENNSDEQQERYTLRVTRILQRGLLKIPESSSFEVSATRGFYVGWTLSED